MDFHDGSHGVHLGFPIRMILTILDLQVALILPTKQVNWPFGSEEKDFQHGGYGDHLRFLIETILAISNLQVTRILPIKFRVNWPFRLGKEFQIRISRCRLRRPS